MHALYWRAESSHSYREASLGLALDTTVSQGALVTDTCLSQVPGRGRGRSGGSKGQGREENTSFSLKLITRSPNYLVAFIYLLLQAMNLNEVTHVSVVSVRGQVVQFQ